MSRRSLVPVLVALFLSAGVAPAALAQTAAPAPIPPPAAGSKPGSPEAYVEKSIHDLSRGSVGAAVNDDVKALRRGPLLIHGNYCGIGNRPGTQPVDALDAACERHDACTKTGHLPSCACDNRLRAEAGEIARDPRTPADIQALAVAMVGSMTVLICK